MTGPRPNFFIVGGPKCGTHTVYFYLKEHPQVFMPERKEPHFFCPDLYSPHYVRDEATYLALFREGAGRDRIGEASVYYLYSREAARRIKVFSPEAEIIIMLRNPVDMLHSLHSQRFYSGHENISDFAEALESEPERRLGRRLPAYPYPIPVLFYREVGKYAAQVARYLDTFGEDHVHVIVFDDLATDTPGVLRTTCSFLGIDPAFPMTSRLENPNKRIRSQVLRDVMKFSGFTSWLARRLFSRELRRRLGRQFVRLNTEYVSRPPMPEGLRAELQAGFAPDVAALSRLLGRDLTHWCVAPTDEPPVGQPGTPVPAPPFEAHS